MTAATPKVGDFQEFLADVADASVVLGVQKERIQKLERDLVIADQLLEKVSRDDLSYEVMDAVRFYLYLRKAHP